MRVELKFPNKPVEVLLVEDNPGDVRMMKEIIIDSRYPIYLSVASDGTEALEMLRLGEDFGEKDKPDLIILDLNLPRLTGHEVLAVIRRDPWLKATPVLIMSSSQASEDLQLAYQNDANFYMVKPLGIEHFAGIMRFIEDYFFEKMDLG
jgi:CheY-like chemotaxis protein